MLLYSCLHIAQPLLVFGFCFCLMIWYFCTSVILNKILPLHAVPSLTAPDRLSTAPKHEHQRTSFRNNLRFTHGPSTLSRKPENTPMENGGSSARTICWIFQSNGATLCISLTTFHVPTTSNETGQIQWCSCSMPGLPSLVLLYFAWDHRSPRLPIMLPVPWTSPEPMQLGNTRLSPMEKAGSKTNFASTITVVIPTITSHSVLKGRPMPISSPAQGLSYLPSPLC